MIRLQRCGTQPASATYEHNRLLCVYWIAFIDGRLRLFDGQVIHHWIATGNLLSKFLCKLLNVIRADFASVQQHAFFKVTLKVRVEFEGCRFLF